MAGLKKQSIKEIIAYVICGFFTMVISIGSFLALTKLCAMHYMIAETLSLIAAITFAFFANKVFVFQSKSFQVAVLSRELIQFLSARAVVSILDIATMFLLVSVLSWDEGWSKVFVGTGVTILNYLFSKLWVFQRHT